MPVKDQVSPSQFNRRISILAPTIGADAQGITTTYSVVYNCAADKQNMMHGRGLYRKLMYQQLYPQTTVIFQIRWQASVKIDATMKVQEIAHGQTHLYKITGVENPNEANVSLYLLCMEDQAKAVN